jgi:hypothetical protein
MPIAKQTLLIGFTPAAAAGSYVTKEAVKQYGWEDQVEQGDDIGGSDEPAPKPKKATASS